MEFLVLELIGIEVIVEMHSIDRVSADNIHNNFKDIVTHFREPRIKPFIVSIGYIPVRMTARNMLGGDTTFMNVHYTSEWVEPSMYFNSTFMTFFNHEFQGVVIWGRASPLFAGKPFAPWFYAIFIKRIRGRTYLNKYSVELIFFQAIYDCNKFLFLLFRGKVFIGRPVNVFYGSDPNTPELSFGI